MEKLLDTHNRLTIATEQQPSASPNNSNLPQTEHDVFRNKNIEHYHAVDLQSDVEVVIENGSTEAKLLLLQGKPIDEPVVQHGPFVMNSKIEIQQAFNDYHQTQFGGWPWSTRDQVHDKSRGRFALHADGKLETKG